jgi:hypothetical protein
MEKILMKKHLSGLRTVGTGAALALATLAATATVAHAEVLQMPKKVCDGTDTIVAVLTFFGLTAAIAGLILIGINLVMSHQREDGGFVLGKLGKWGIGAVVIGVAPLLAGLFISATLNCG